MKNSMIILASSSPRRIEMMKENGIEPVIIKPTCEETLPPGITGEDAVRFLSLKKAFDVEEKIKAGAETDGEFGDICKEAISRGAYIIAADTIVYKEEIIGKPKDREDAYSILRGLSGKEHYVITGVSIVRCGKPEKRSFAEVTKVFFKDYTDEELNAYLDTDEPYDKAGAYAIQGLFGEYVDHIEGDLNNVIGFPWDRIVYEFEKMPKKEYWDVYTIDCVRTGKIVEKGNYSFTGDEYQLAVEAWIMNDKGEFLIQQRSYEVEILPGVWAMTTGRIKSGEEPLYACVREVSEEVGLNFEPEDLTHIYHFVNHSNNMIWDLYLMKWNGDVSELSFQPNEVAQAAWVSEEELRRMLANDEVYCYPEVYEVLDIINKL